MMKHTAKHIAGLLAILCSIAFTGCDGGYDCSLNNIAYNRINFYTGNNGVENSYELPDALTVSLMINGSDSIVVNHITGTSKLSLPMCYTSSCDTLVFSYGNGAADTLYLEHDNIPIYQSMECGVIMHHRLTGTRYTRNLIDSIAINEASINFDENENIKLYFVE